MLICSSQISGKISVPPSKSQTFRAILFAALAKGESRIENILESPDTTYLIDALRTLGVEIVKTGDKLFVRGGSLREPEEPLYLGNSGIALRFLTGIVAAFGFEASLMGDDSLRTMDDLLDGLKQFGVEAVSFSDDGRPPIKIRGPLKKGRAIIDGSDSQPVSSLLIGAALSKGKFELAVKNPGEKPWVNLTLDWLGKLGIEAANDQFKRFVVKGGRPFSGFHYKVPGDYSSSAFPIAAALITGSRLCVQNLDSRDPQGDKKIIDVLIRMGADIEETPSGLLVKGGRPLKGDVIDINDFIDGVVILAVVGCFAEGETVLTNGKAARKKECDRLLAAACELKKMGADIEQTEDGIRVRQSKLKGCEVDSWGDHRMALSLAVAGLGAHGQTFVKNAACIAKTYPAFVEDFQKLGAKIS